MTPETQAALRAEGPRGGTSANRYEHVMELARGGMARVQLVMRREGEFERLYAMKRLRDDLRDEPELRTMFVHEARVAGLVRNAHAVPVVDVGEDVDGPFLVMEYVEGLSLTAILAGHVSRAKPLPIQLALRICAHAARGLHAAHELRDGSGRPLHVVHRDVSPQNILVGFDGVARVTDFGIARTLERAQSTLEGVVRGKSGYMAPEQVRLEPLDRRTDLFALGVVLFEALTGSRLYRGDIANVARRILEEPPPDLGEHREDAPDSVVELLFELLAKEPARRPESARIVAERLEHTLAELGVVEGPLDASAYLEREFSEERETLRARVSVAVDEHTARTRVERAPRAIVPPSRGSRALWIALAVALAGLGGAAALYAYDEAAPTAPVERTRARVEEPPSAPPEPEPATELAPAAVEAQALAPEEPRERSRVRRARPSEMRADEPTEMSGVSLWGWMNR